MNKSVKIILGFLLFIITIIFVSFITFESSYKFYDTKAQIKGFYTAPKYFYRYVVLLDDKGNEITSKINKSCKEKAVLSTVNITVREETFRVFYFFEFKDYLAVTGKFCL